MDTVKKEQKPAYADVMKFVGKIAKNNKYVKVETAGKSFEGRELPVLFITDPKVSDEDKQVVFITAGTHGSEEAGRACGMALIEHLASGKDPETLKKQLFVIFPCVNPDGSIRDTYHNAQDKNIYKDYRYGEEPEAAEAKVVWKYAKKYIPELCIDLHGLAGGSMKECIYLHADFPSNINTLVSSTIAYSAQLGAEKAGYPQGEAFVHGIYPQGIKGLPQACISNFNSIGFTLEMTENYYTIKENRESGMARLKEILKWGNKKSFNQPYSGYPVNIISGSSMWAFVSHGATAGKRRENRRDVFKALKRIPALERLSPDKDGAAIIRFEVTGEDTDVPQRYAVQCRLHNGAKLKSVIVDGRKMKEQGGEDGYVLRSDTCSKFALVSVNEPMAPGKHELKLNYNIKFFEK